MNRRSLLAAALGLLSASSVGRLAWAGERLWSRLGAGQRFALVREPDNSHDETAIRIDWRGRKLGYVPRHHNAALAKLLDDGELLEARILRLRESANPWGRVQIGIFLPV